MFKIMAPFHCMVLLGSARLVSGTARLGLSSLLGYQREERLYFLTDNETDIFCVRCSNKVASDPSLAVSDLNLAGYIWSHVASSVRSEDDSLLRPSVISRVYTSRFGNGNGSLGTSAEVGTKKSIRYQVQYAVKTTPK